MKLLMEYDRTKKDENCEECQRFYKRLDAAAIEDVKNITQITAHKAIVEVSEKVQKDYEDSIIKALQ